MFGGATRRCHQISGTASARTCLPLSGGRHTNSCENGPTSQVGFLEISRVGDKDGLHGKAQIRRLPTSLPSLSRCGRGSSRGHTMHRGTPSVRFIFGEFLIEYAKMKYPNLSEEKKLWGRGFRFVACIDEVGRGPLAGPVVTAAVCLNLVKDSLTKLRISFPRLKDSKQLSPKRREEIYKKVKKYPAIQWGIGIISEKVIDKINIYQATKLAMKRAVRNLEKKLIQRHQYKYSDSCYSRKHYIIDFLIVDGNMELGGIQIPQKAIVKGDEKVFSCALASIIAKVARDRMMVRYHKKYPQYGFDRHKGYGTSLHLAMLKKYGPCPIHRMSFSLLQK